MKTERDLQLLHQHELRRAAMLNMSHWRWPEMGVYQCEMLLALHKGHAKRLLMGHYLDFAVRVHETRVVQYFAPKLV